jgi:hypothetical protein
MRRPKWGQIRCPLPSMGGPGLGVPIEAIAEQAGLEQNATERLLELLEDHEWARGVTPGFISAGGTGPTFAPTPQAMQRLGGWPAPGEDATGRFLAALDAVIEETNEQEGRSRLTALRDAASRVGQEVLAQVLSKLATSQLHF